jgi:hypothetical protein
LSAIIPAGPRHHVKSQKGALLLGVDLKDAKEEIFVRMVCDGLALGIAYARAGFKAKNNAAPSLLFQLPRIQARAAAILEARRTTGVVTLSEVTDMLQRVFAGAHAKEEYSAAHNAAFSLARLYGHVTDKATLEVIRRPSRDPDAPSEQVLSDWVASLPVVGPSGPAADGSIGPLPKPPPPPPPPPPPEGPTSRAPAALLGLEARPEPSSQRDLFNDINGLAEGSSPGGTGNGAPTDPVTGAPHKRARSTPLEQVPVKKRGKSKIPSAKDLFG